MTIIIDGVLRRGDWSADFDGTRIDPGVTAVVGPNGSGKTSLLRLIAGLEAIDAGRVCLDDQVVDEPSTTTFVECHLRPIAMVFQDIRLFDHLRAVDNVAFPMRRQGASRRDSRENAMQYLETVGMAPLAHARPGELSGGQRQRVAIARAMATGAKVLLLDEPLASIDEASKPSIRRALTNGPFHTVVWVTHSDEDAAAADRVISLAESAT